MPTVKYIHHKIGLAWLKEKLSKLWTPYEGPNASMKEWIIDGKMSPKHKKHPYKVCPCCEEEKHLSEFKLRLDRSADKGYIVPRTYCNDCRTERRRERYKASIEKWDDDRYVKRKIKYTGDRYARMKETKKILLRYFGERCSYIHKDGKQCDFKYVDPCQMEFDHIDPSTKKFTLTSMEAAAVDIDDFIEEVEKCQLMCANCHKLKTFIDHKL